jgi:alpha-1,6-mannosyl-glycoprotein beta-1,2-N-acetylglucosaminyltransferase
VNGTGQTLNKAFLEKLNSLEHVYNADDFPALSSEDMIFVVQVHKRIHYLRYLLESFSQAKDIGQVLLIFSHDYYDEEINKQIQSIKYCKVLQLFFPYSMQLHPNTFPGESPDDCGRDFTREQARKVKCANWEHPDHYGHYRTASVTAIKHHWWWKINKVFDGLKLTANFNGTVFFLEEDHYISPDAVVVARDLVQLRRRSAREPPCCIHHHVVMSGLICYDDMWSLDLCLI